MYGIKDLLSGQYVVQHDGLKVNCTIYKSFWLSWDDGYLRVGEGMCQTKVGNRSMFYMYPFHHKCYIC